MKIMNKTCEYSAKLIEAEEMSPKTWMKNTMSSFIFFSVATQTLGNQFNYSSIL